MKISQLVLPIALALVVACHGTVTGPNAPEKNEETASETTGVSDTTEDTTSDETDDSDTIEDTTDGTEPTETDTDPVDDTADGADDLDGTGETTDPTDDETGDIEEEPCEDGPTCKGTVWPDWALEDFQPSSPRFGENYGLDTFEGTVTVM